MKKSAVKWTLVSRERKVWYDCFIYNTIDVKKRQGGQGLKGPREQGKGAKNMYSYSYPLMKEYLFNFSSH
jgi:hypothetical protein